MSNRLQIDDIYVDYAKEIADSLSQREKRVAFYNSIIDFTHNKSLPFKVNSDLIDKLKGEQFKMSLHDCSKFTKAKKDDYWSRISYGKVIECNTEHLVIRNDDGYEWTIGFDVVENELCFHNQYKEEIELTWTELKEKFKESTRMIMTVNFNKKIDEKEYIKKLTDLYPNKGGKLKSKKQYELDIKDATKSLLKGEERTMIGRHYGTYKSERIIFIDMELENDDSKDYDTRIRLVDLRSLNWMITDGVKYILKK